MRMSFTQKGSFDHMESFLNSMLRMDLGRILEPYAQQGVAALQAATPVDSGLAARSWSYEIESTPDFVRIVWTNDDVENGFPVALMLQYGYSTGTGGYVQGRDYINPAIKPIFDEIANGVWKVVTSS